MSASDVLCRRIATAALASLAVGIGAAPGPALAATGFGPLSGPGGCVVGSEGGSSEDGTSACAVGKALSGPHAVAVSPDGANVYVAGGVAGNDVAMSFGAVVILKRDATTGAITETGCLSSDGTDGRDGASGACTPTPSLLGADGVAVSPDGSTVFVSSSSSASVVAFSRNPTSGSLTRLGCFQGSPRPGAPCGAANLFSSAGALTVAPSGSALYVAASLEGAISTLAAPPSAAPVSGAAAGTGAGTTTTTTPSGTPTSGTATTATPAPGTGTAVAPASGATPAPTLASIFTTPPRGTFLANPCIAVNGLDGPCEVGTATQGLNALALSSDGKELYATAPGSHALDVFALSAAGTLAETSCLKVKAPPGLCTPATLINAPDALAVSPDGKNVYAGDSLGGGGGAVDVLTRNPTTGALTDSSCVDFMAKPAPPEANEEGEGKEEHKVESPPVQTDPCTGAPGLNEVSVVAVSGDGSSVYAFGSGSAAIFSRDPASGKLTETSCAVNDDSRCTSLPALRGVSGAAVSPDGREVYVVATRSNAVMVFSIGATVTTPQASASRAGTASVRVACPAGLRRACSGRVELTRAVSAATGRHGHRIRVSRTTLGRSAVFSIGPGRQASVRLRLTPAARRLLLSRRHLRLMAVVRAAPSAGGSGYGRHLVLRLRS